MKKAEKKSNCIRSFPHLLELQVEKLLFSADEAERLKEQMQDTILVRIETSPNDINGMHAAKGILTARGGMTSHAAVVARGMGKPCVSGSSEINIDYENKLFKSGDYQIKEGDVITIDGGSGKVMLGKSSNC